MRIGIDASRAFGEERTGTENYSYEIITRILALPEAENHEWILYLRMSNFQFSNFNFQSISKYKNIKIINIPIKYLWTQAGLAYRTWVDRLDVLWVPAHTLPVLRPSGQSLKTVVTIHGIEYEWLPAYENVLQRWYLPLSTLYAVKSATKIIAVSKFTGEQIIKKMGADPKKIEVIWEGAENTTLLHLSPSVGGRSETEVLKRYRLDSKQYLLFVGTVQPRKNLVRLMKAFQALGAEGSGLKLVIAGKLGWNYEEVTEEAEKNPNVIITGYVSNKERQILLKNALAYVQPSITEGFGLPVIEAFQMGIPVISSYGGALKEIAGDAGLMFDPYNIQDMIRSLKLAVSSWPIRNKLIKLGKRRARDFSWEHAANETLKVLLSCN